MSEWLNTSWADQEHITKFIDENNCWWHRWGWKYFISRIKRGVHVSFDRIKEWGRKPYIDGSNWGIITYTDAKSRKLAQEKPLQRERRIRGKKI